MIGSILLDHVVCIVISYISFKVVVPYVSDSCTKRIETLYVIVNEEYLLVQRGRYRNVHITPTRGFL